MKNPLALIPTVVRAWLYLGLILGGPIVAYLQAKGTIGTLEVSLFGAYVALLGGTAITHLGEK